jgi:putative copper export protein
MDGGLFVVIVQWLHVLAAVLWFGGAVFLSLLLMPTFPVLPPEQQRRFGRALTAKTGPFFQVAAIVVLLMGIIRGTLLGPIKGVDVLFGTVYGQIWLAALILTIGLVVLGARFVGPTAERMYQDDSLWDFGPGQPPPAGLMAHVQLLRTLSIIDLLGFLIVFTLMIMLRFS